jgi:hypothetical protein
MSKLSAQNLKRVYRELDEIGVAISLAGTRRQKLMELARLVVPISDAPIGVRPAVKRVRDDLVRLTHNVRRVQTKQRTASRAVAALAAQIEVVQKLVSGGLGDVPETFDVGEMILMNTWGYTTKEVKSFMESLKSATGMLDKMGLTQSIGTVKVVLHEDGSPRVSMTYDLFSDTFVANPTLRRGRYVGISDAIGGRVWLKNFGQRDVETWGGSSRAWILFSNAFFRLMSEKSLSVGDDARMAVTLGRVIGPERWSKVA